MTRRRWIADEISGNRAALTGEHAAHLVRVLRARIGQEFDIVANGILRRGAIISIAGNRVEFDLGSEIPAEAIPPHLTLLLSIFKFDRMEWAIEKCTELGVIRIIPIIARRTDAHLTSASVKRVERWRRIALQASEQSRRAIPPEIDDPAKLRDTLAHPATSKIVLSESEDQTHLREVTSHGEIGETFLAVGPEGGWTQDELDLFKKEGWCSASLGPTILRTETAAIAATAIVLASMNA